MPILDPQLRVFLKEQGIDPDSIPDEQDDLPQNPVVKPTPKSQQTTALGAFAGEAARNIGPTGIGIGVTAAVSPFATPFVGIPAGIGASLLARKLQDSAVRAIAPNSGYDESEQEHFQEHSTASTLGGIASAGLFLRPSISALKPAGQGLRNLVTGVAPSANEVGALTGATLGAALPTAIRAYSDPNVSPEELALEAAGGLFLNKPTALGRRIGLHGVEAKAPLIENQEGLIKASKEGIPYIEPEIAQQNKDYQAELASSQNDTLKQKAEAEAQAALDSVKGKEHEVLKQRRLEDEEAKAPTIEAEQLINEAHAAYLKTKAEAETQRQNDLTKSKPEEIQQSIAQGKTLAVPENRPKPLITTETGKEIYPDYTGNQEIDAEINKRTPLTEAEQIQEQFDTRNQPQSNVVGQLQEQGISPNVTKQWHDIFEKLGVQRGVKLGQDNLLVQNGKEINGRAYLRQGVEEALAKYHPEKGKIDTLPHEIFHVFYDDLLKHGTEGDQKFLSKMNDRIAESENYKSWAKENKGGVEEYLTTLTGEDTVRRLLKTDKSGKVGNFFKDFWSHVKSKMGTATDEDYARIMSNRLLNEKPFGEMVEGKKVPVVSASIKNQEESRLKETATNLKPDFTIPFIRPENEKVRKVSPPLAEGFHNFYDKNTLNYGKFHNVFDQKVRDIIDLNGVIKSISKSPTNYLKQNTPELDNVREWFWAKDRGDKLPTLTEKEQQIKQAIIDSNKLVQSESQIRPGIKNVEKFNPENLAQTVDKSVLSEVLSNPDSPKSLELRKDFIKYNQKKGLSLEESQAKLDQLLKGASRADINTAKQFGPLDAEEGMHIPESWREKNLLEIQNRFLDRVGRRISYHDAIQQPGLEPLIEKFKGNDSVRTVYNDIAGNKVTQDDPKISSVMGVVRASIMGTLTGQRDASTGLTLGWQHIEPHLAIKNTIKAIGTLKQNLAEGYEAGRIRRHISSLEVGNGTDDLVSYLKRARDVISDLTGRNWFDKVIRAINYGTGRFTTLDYHEELLKGKPSRTAQKWFEDFAKGIDWNKDQLTSEDLKNIAGRFVDSVQGAYNYTMLPKVAMEGSMAPYLQLARWSIEKTNNFVKYTWNPLLKGDPRPLLMSTTGMLLGGAATQYITSLNTGRKDKTASLEELQAASSEGHNVLPDAAYKAMGLISASSHIGILGDVIKSIMDVTYGKNRPQVYNNILLETAENSATTIANVVKAINDDGLNSDILLGGISQFLEDNLQTYRILSAHLGSETKEDIEKANKLRDLRVYNTLSGQGIADLSSPFAQKGFDDLPLKKFKRTDDLEEAATMLPDLIGKAIEKANGDPEVLKKELTKIKKNNYQIMPDPNKWPLSFTNYVNFLSQTQGTQAAEDRIMDYITKKNVNQVKASLIP